MVLNGRLRHHHFGTSLPCGFAAPSGRGSPFHSLGAELVIRILRFLLGLVFATIAILTATLWFSSPPYVVLLTMIFAVLAAWSMGYDTGLSRSHRETMAAFDSRLKEFMKLDKAIEKTPEFQAEYQRIEREARQKAERMEKELEAELTANPPPSPPLQGTPAGKPAAPLS